MTPQIYADSFSRAQLYNGVLRIELTQVDNDDTVKVGELLLPATTALQSIEALQKSLKDMADGIRKRQEDQKKDVN